jgi:Tol biopolymer transport system component
LLLGVAASTPSTAAVPKTRRVSVRSNGTERDGHSYIFKRAVSQDGSIIAFESDADLVAADDNGVYDIYVRNMRSGRIERVSISTNGTEGLANSGDPEISANGRIVVFRSQAALVSSDVGGWADVYRHNRGTGRTTRVSVAPNGEEADFYSGSPSISPNGRYIAFPSLATNLVPDDDNQATDIFLKDLQTGSLTRVSVQSDGDQVEANSDSPSVANDGTVAWDSVGSGFVPNDENANYDIFVHRPSGRTRRVSVATNGDEGSGASTEPTISLDGDSVAFLSDSDNFAQGAGGDQTDVFVRRLPAQRTILASKRSNGDRADDNSQVYQGGALSYSGRYVAFQSTAENLVAGDDNGVGDMFWHDTQSGKTKLLSVTHNGSELNDDVLEGSISGNGRFVAFDSAATNLVPNDGNETQDVFRRGPIF